MNMFKKMVAPEGIEPPTIRVETVRSIQLSYEAIKIKRTYLPSPSSLRTALPSSVN